MAAEFGSARTVRAIRGLLHISEADRVSLSIIARSLDLPSDDAETISFLTDALTSAAADIRVRMLQERATRIKEQQP